MIRYVTAVMLPIIITVLPPFNGKYSEEEDFAGDKSII